jgi:HlyD family secretion protein
MAELADTVAIRGRAGAQNSATRADGIGQHVSFGHVLTAALIGGVGWWAGTSSIAGAIVASGTVVVESNVKKVQLQTGGTVRAILVRNGDHVRVGDTLVRFDDRVAAANLQIMSQQLDRTRLRMARLAAEAAGSPVLTVPPALVERVAEPDVAAVLAGEKNLLASDLGLLNNKKGQLASRNRQYLDQIEGLNAQRDAARDALALSQGDLVDVEDLYNRKLAPRDRLTALKMQIVQQKGEIGRLTAAIAEAEGRISENAVMGLQIEDDFRKSANSDLRDTEAKEVELAERQRVARSQLDDTVVIAPQDGIVQELNIHTVGGVVAPGETMMVIVPGTDELVIDAQVAPQHIDEVYAGQPVVVRFSAFDRTVTPECHGTVKSVSADLIRDAASRTAYYSARIDVSDEATCLGKDKTLVPGMPTELHIQTGERTVWSYIFKPLSDQLLRSFRE